MTPQRREPLADLQMGEWRARERYSTGSGRLLDATDHTIARFRSFGLQVDGTDRLSKAYEFVSTFSNGHVEIDVNDDALLDRIALSNTTLWDCRLIAEYIAAAGEQPSAAGLIALEHMLRGDDALITAQDPQPWNTQFELFLLSLFRAAGYTADLGEPDIRLIYGTEDVGLAAKRLSSKKALSPRVDEAVEQIERAAGRGFVAVNVDKYLDEDIPAGELQERGAYAQRRFLSLRAAFEKHKDNPAFLGLIGVGNGFSWDHSGPLPRLSQSMFVQVMGTAIEGEPSGALFHAFFDELQSRVEERVRLLYSPR
jgi:hypothetical protein